MAAVQWPAHPEASCAVSAPLFLYASVPRTSENIMASQGSSHYMQHIIADIPLFSIDKGFYMSKLKYKFLLNLAQGKDCDPAQPQKRCTRMLCKNI